MQLLRPRDVLLLLLQALLDKPMDPASGHPQALMKRPYALSPLEAVAVVTRRQFLMVLKDSGLIKGRLMQVGLGVWPRLGPQPEPVHDYSKGYS